LGNRALDRVFVIVIMGIFIEVDVLIGRGLIKLVRFYVQTRRLASIMVGFFFLFNVEADVEGGVGLKD
jgi:hypothetical protein